MTMTARVGERQDQTLVGGQVRLNGARVGSTKDDGVGVVEKVVSKGRATNQPDHPANGPRGPRRTVSVTGHHNQPLTRPPLPSSSTHHHRRQPGRPPYPSIHHHCSSQTHYVATKQTNNRSLAHFLSPFIIAPTIYHACVNAAAPAQRCDAMRSLVDERKRRMWRWIFHASKRKREWDIKKKKMKRKRRMNDQDAEEKREEVQVLKRGNIGYKEME
ncbi:hypothetical protein HDK77DRAFT_6781 [Phyllosticta capitalensis]